MDYVDVNHKYEDVILRMNIGKDGAALVVFRDGSAGCFPNPESLNDTLEKKYGQR